MALYRSLGARPDDTRGTTALEVRKDLARIFTGPGVLPGADSPLVVGSDVFAYVVRSAGWVTSRGEGDGVHLWGNDGDLTVSEADDGSSLVAPAPGLSRIDCVYALHPSDSENGDTTSEPLVAVRKGVEASVPVAPGLPVGGLELGRNTMTSAATSTSSAGNTIAQTARLARLAKHGEWRRYTPSFGSGWSLGSSTVTGRYLEEADLVHVELLITLAAGATVGSGNITLPVAGTATSMFRPIGRAFLNSAALSGPAARRVWDVFLVASSPWLSMGLMNGATGEHPSMSNPWAWGAGDTIGLFATYRRG